MTNQASVDQPFDDYCRQLRGTSLRNRKVLLVQCPQFLPGTYNADIARRRGYYAFPPAGLLWIAGVFTRSGFEVEVLDLNYEILYRTVVGGENSPDWRKILDDRMKSGADPAIIGVSCLSVGIDILSEDHPLTGVLRHLRKKTDAIIIAGGAIATNEYRALLQEGLCHFVVEGEGENKVGYLLKTLMAGAKDVPASPGIYYCADVDVRQTLAAKERVELKGNLIEAYGLVPLVEYCRVGSLNPFSRMAGLDRPFAGLQLNRGCRGDCKFCGVTDLMGKGVRQFPVEDVAAEVSYLVKVKGVRHFEVLDDDFLGGPGQSAGVKILLKGMAGLHRDHGITWAAGNGLIVASITRELLDLMRDSGCVGFRVGIESGSDAMLRKLQKPATLRKIREIAALLQDYPEMFVGGNFIIGLLGEETFGEMLASLRYALEINLDWMAVTTFQLTSKANAERKHIGADGRPATDFIPAKDTRSGAVHGGTHSLGLEVFALDPRSVPGREEIRDIWFAFNLVANYVFNKNLLPGGNVLKFVRWVEAINAGYPDNAYMPLFSGIGYVLAGQPDKGQERFREAQRLLAVSPYWQERFRQFFLTDLAAGFPADAAGAYAVLDALRKKTTACIPELDSHDG